MRLTVYLSPEKTRQFTRKAEALGLTNYALATLAIEQIVVAHPITVTQKNRKRGRPRRTVKGFFEYTRSNL